VKETTSIGDWDGDWIDCHGNMVMADVHYFNTCY